MSRLLLLIALYSSLSSAGPIEAKSALTRNTFYVETGTAFQVSYKNRKYLVSNWHVCRDMVLKIAYNEYSKKKYKVEILKVDPLSDLCVLTPADSEGLKLGSDLPNLYQVYTAGYPAYSRNKLVMSSGVTMQDVKVPLDFGPGYCPRGMERETTNSNKVSRSVGFTPEYHCWNTIALKDTTLKGEGGCSGSAVVDSNAKLVGVVNSTNKDTVSYLPLSSLIKVLSSLDP